MARRDDDDDYDDDDRPARRREDKSSGGGMPKWPFFLLGGLVLVLLLCGGVGAAVYFLVYKAVSGVVAAAKSMIPAPPGTYEASDEEITAQLNDLKGPNKFFALQHITGFKPDPKRRDEVCQALEPLLTDATVGSQAAQALAIWGTAKSCPALHRALENQQNFGTHSEVINALVAIKDPSSVGSLVKRLTDPFDRQAASAALKKFGPMAEKEVVKYLENIQNDPFGRQEACNILAEIGTKKGSLAALQKAATDQNFSVKSAANTAITSVNSRP